MMFNDALGGIGRDVLDLIRVFRITDCP